MKTTFHIIIVIIWTVFCFGSGYIWYDTTNENYISNNKELATTTAVDCGL